MYLVSFCHKLLDILEIIICSNVDGFIDRLSNIVGKFIDLGFSKGLLKSRFISISRKHEFNRNCTMMLIGYTVYSTEDV